MPIYIYKAVTKENLIVRNRVEEMSKFALLKKLKSNNLSPISVTQINAKMKKTSKKQKKNVESNNSVLNTVRKKELERSLNSGKKAFGQKVSKVLMAGSKITNKDISVFTENFYLLKKANFNNIHALTTIIETTENLSLKAILEDILVGVEAGESMYSTMEYYEGVFPPIYISMIKVGELSGSLTNALEQAVQYLDETAALNKKIKGILVPNLVQFIGLLVLLVVGTLVSIPQIQNVFDQVGTDAELPALTIGFKNFLDGFVKNWYIPTGISVIIIGTIIFYIRTPQGKYNFHYFKYKMPVFGKLIYAIDFSRLIRAILLNIKNGMRIQDALETSKNISKNLVMLSLIESAINNILVGQSWIEPFEQSGLSSTMVTEMLRIGMQTDLAEMMEKLLEYMQIDIDNIMQKVIKILPQIVYSIAGALLIFVVLVVVVPLIQVYMGTWLFDAYL